MSTLINQAIAIAKQAHANQWRRDGITPYIMHPRAVAERLQGESDEVIATAWLHDVLEDNLGWGVKDLAEAGIPWNIVDAVYDLTKHEGEDYDKYLHSIKLNPIALKVKIADILCNLADQPTDKQIKKYAKALVFLIE
jgi:(p)ppGpp synthase/HD superfamily hydrolase